MDMGTVRELLLRYYRPLAEYAHDAFTKPKPSHVLAGSAGVLGAWLIWTKWRNRNQKLPPGPRGWPVLGNMLDISEDTLHMDLLRLQERDNLPDIFTIRFMPGSEMIILNSHAAIKDAFVSQGDLFAERPAPVNFEVMEIRDEIFSKPYKDPTWNEGKQFIMSALRNVGFGNNKCTEDKILEQFQILEDHLKPMINDGRPIDLSTIIPKAMSNVILQLLLGKEYSLDDPELVNWIQTFNTWYAAQKNAFILDLVPTWFRKLFLRNLTSRLLKVTEDCKQLIRESIKEHEASLDPENPRDFLDVYISKKEGHFDMETLASTTFAFLPDAMDTTATLMRWVILYICHHPDVLKKIQKECDSVTTGNRLVTWADRRQLPYTEAAIMESIRASSAVAFTGYHTAIRDCYYRGYYIPAGLPILGNLYAAMMDPTNFPEPDKFDPGRFLDESGTLLKTDAWIPFGMGRRKCLGQQIAKMEIFLFVANLFQCYELSFSDENPLPSLEPIQDIIQKPKPYKVILSHRM